MRLLNRLEVMKGHTSSANVVAPFPRKSMCPYIDLAASRLSQGGWPMAITIKVASSVYSPSTSAKQPSVNSPSEG